MEIIIITLILIRIVVALSPPLNDWIKNTYKHLKQRLVYKKNIHVFSQTFIDTKAFYLREFGKVPCISYVDDVDVSKVFDLVNQGLFGEVEATYQRNYYDWDDKQMRFSRTVFKLKNKVMVELVSDYAEVLFPVTGYDLANRMIEAFSQFKEPAKEQAYEINIITLNGGSLDLKTLEIKPTPLDVNLYYNDDFLKVDALIKERLLKENDKGIILLHGLPGTGKTTYLRHLIGSLKKRVLFVSPAVASNLMNPEFIDLLIDNPNSVLVIEDAEDIIMDRKYSSNSSVSNLLNLSDGLMSDCLNVQIICTFNNAIEMVDSALMRKGRLIAKYEFGKLETVKAQALSNHLGHDTLIKRPMTLAEITNQHELQFETKQVQVIGFRREAMIEN